MCKCGNLQGVERTERAAYTPPMSDQQRFEAQGRDISRPYKQKTIFESRWRALKDPPTKERASFTTSTSQQSHPACRASSWHRRRRPRPGRPSRSPIGQHVNRELAALREGGHVFESSRQRHGTNSVGEWKRFVTGVDDIDLLEPEILERDVHGPRNGGSHGPFELEPQP